MSHSSSPRVDAEPIARAGGFLPFAVPDIGEEEIDAVVRVLRSGWITTGPEVQAFQQEFARYIGVRHALAVNSCTAALHLALEAAGVGAGDEVLTSTVTFTATAEVVEYLGGRTRFVDVGAADLNLDPARLRELIEREYVRRGDRWHHRASGGALKAIVPVHYAGQPCAMDAILPLARDYGLFVVDDAAHALPAALHGTKVGAMDVPTAFSFYATKTLTTGEGGMLCTNDDRIAERAKLMALHGISRDAWKRYAADGTWYYEVVEAGFKYNMTDIAAALGRVQLQRLEQIAAARTAIAGSYEAALGRLEQLETPQVRPGVTHAWHLYPLRLRLETLTIDRARFIQELRERQIGTSVHFIPLHRQPFYADRYRYCADDFPVAEAEYPRLISLPIYSRMTPDDVASVVNAVSDVIDRYRR